MKVLTFWVDGRPVPKERARTVRTKRGKYCTYTPPRTAAWEQRVRLVAQAACSATGWRPVMASYSVHVDVYRARRAGDGDNFLKAAKDALNGVVWPDDRMSVQGSYHVYDGQGVGMRVRVTRADLPEVGRASEPNMTGAE